MLHPLISLIIFLLATTMAVILYLARSKQNTNYWYSGFIFSMGLGLLAEFIDPKPSTVVAAHIELLTLTARFCSALSYRFSTCFFLLIGISVLDIKPRQRKRLYLILSLPVIIGFAYDLIFWDQGFIKIYLDYAPNFWILAIWGIMCGIITNALLFYSFIIERSHHRRLHKFLLFIITFPSLFLTYQAYINPLIVKGRHDFAYITGLLTGTIFLSAIIAAFKYGFLGIRLSIERETRENSLKLITSGTLLIAHSLKNEIGKIHSAAETLESKASNAEFLAIANIIQNSTSHLQQVIERMRDRTQEIILMKEKCNICDIIDVTLDSIITILNERKITVFKQYHLNPVIDYDKVHMREVLQNILKNSIEALLGSSTGIINIKVWRQKRYVKIEIQDNGVGISTENLPHIFDPFFSTKRMDSNFGLGLTYCFNVVQKHNGHLNIASEVGHGTNVIIDLPL